MRAATVDMIRTRQFAGVRPNHRGHPTRKLVCGFDVETTPKGEPYALGFGVQGEPVQVTPVTSATCWPTLAAHLRSAMRRHAKPMVVCGAHNLRFDLGVTLFPHLAKWDAETARRGCLGAAGGISVEYFISKVCFAKVRLGKSNALLCDTFRFFAMSLDRAAAAVGLSLAKLPHPEGFGLRKLPLDVVTPYLVRDVEIVTALLSRVMAWHREYDLYPSVSVAQLSMRVFRRKYVQTKWQALPENVLRASLLAYHAGRNGLYCAPGWRRVKLLDMNSAFPAAMRELPSFCAGSWDRTMKYAGRFGFYRLYAGTVNQGTYPILFDHDFKPLPAGPVREPVWVTGMEYHAARTARLITGDKCYGYVWRPESTERPLRGFVADNWRKRQAAATPEGRLFYKLLLNSLYGKFCAKTEMSGPEAAAELHDPDLESIQGFGVLVAGGQFYPVAAAWITGIVRVWLWDMERRTGAYHSATDGLMVDPATPFTPSDKLGGWKCEGEGWALILRNKFYLVVDDSGTLVKAAYHGFDGSPSDLISMLQTGRRSYRVRRLRGWLEAAAVGRRPFVSESRWFSVSCSLRGFWPPPCALSIPSGDGWGKVIPREAGAAL